jgi:putative oxidoreductase
MTSSFIRSDDLGRLLLRVTIGGLLIFHGVSKLIHGIGWLPGLLAQHGVPEVVAYGVYVGEIVAPVLIILGWKSRLAAWIVVFNMAMAVWLAHPKDLGALKPSGGWGVELDGLFFFGALAIAFLGSGSYSVSKGVGALD